MIFAESHFRDQTSHAGAKGLMQLMPDTADFIAQKSGGTAFEQSDLATPQVNIAYGSWYLRYLLDRYDGSEPLALAAYNAGHGTVDGWLADAAATGKRLQGPPTSRTRRRARTSARCSTRAATTAASTPTSWGSQQSRIARFARDRSRASPRATRR